MADATRDLNAAQHIAKYYTNIQHNIMVFKQFFISKFIVHCTALSPTGYKKRTGLFLRALHVYNIDNFVAF
jgi:hypothetical protein